MVDVVSIPQKNIVDIFTTTTHNNKTPTRFIEPSNPDYVFKPQYSKRVPADGLHVYAEAIWEKIMTNKDLDLPTQQELLAQFRCDEIANQAFATFKDSIKDFRHPIESGQLVENLGPKMKEIRGVAISKNSISNPCRNVVSSPQGMLTDVLVAAFFFTPRIL